MKKNPELRQFLAEQLHVKRVSVRRRNGPMNEIRLMQEERIRNQRQESRGDGSYDQRLADGFAMIRGAEGAD